MGYGLGLAGLGWVGEGQGRVGMPLGGVRPAGPARADSAVAATRVAVAEVRGCEAACGMVVMERSGRPASGVWLGSTRRGWARLRQLREKFPARPAPLHPPTPTPSSTAAASSSAFRRRVEGDEDVFAKPSVSVARQRTACRLQGCGAAGRGGAI